MKMKCMDIPIYSCVAQDGQRHIIYRFYKPVLAKKRSILHQPSGAYIPTAIQSEFPTLHFMRRYVVRPDPQRYSSLLPQVFCDPKYDERKKDVIFSVPTFPHVLPCTHSPRDKGIDYNITAAGQICMDNNNHRHPGDMFFQSPFRYYKPNYPLHGNSLNGLSLKQLQSEAIRSTIIIKGPIFVYPIKVKSLWDEEFVTEVEGEGKDILPKKPDMETGEKYARKEDYINRQL